MPSSDSSPTVSTDERPRQSRRRFLGKTGLAMSVTLPVISSLAGCSDRREPSDPEAVAAIEASIDALATVDGYATDVGGQVEANARGETVTARVDGTHRVDESARRAHIVIEADDDREELYVDGDTVYELCGLSQFVNVENAWYPAETNVDWADVTLLKAQEELLGMSNVYDRGTETRSGRTARVIEFAPDTDEFDRYQRRLRTEESNSPSPDSVTVTQWLVDDRPIRTRSEVDRSSFSGPSMEEDLRYDVTYESVSIDLPPLVDDEEACPSL